jgi:hypothetical protein
MAHLRILQGPGTGKLFPLGDSNVIGRASDVEVPVEALAVSRRHARIVRREGGFFLEDAGSTNGTFFHGQRLTRPVPLTPGDTFQIGPCTFVLEDSETPASSEAHCLGIPSLPIRERIAADPLGQGLHGSDPARQLQAVLQTARHLAGSLDRDELLGKCLAHLFEIIPHATWGQVLVTDGGSLTTRIEKGSPPTGLTPSRALALARQALEEKAGLLAEEEPDWAVEGLDSTAMSPNTRSLLCVPLLGRDGRPLAVVQLGREGPPLLQKDDLAVLMAVAVQVAVLVENASLLAERSRRPGETPPPRAAVSPAFSSHTVVTRYPAPVALAYRRFCRQPDSATRLRMLFAALESTLRYLVTLGVCDLFHRLILTGEADARLPDHPAFDFLRRARPMHLGLWAETLRETARTLAAGPTPLLPEIAATCAPGGRFDAECVAPLIALRNDCIHAEGGLTLTPDECQNVLRTARPRLEEALQEVHFISRYPLGFVRRSPGAPATPDRHRYYLHPCMGAHVANTVEAHAIETPVPLQEDLPFVVTPDDGRLLYLWPLLSQRVAAHTGRHTLYVFESIADRHGAYLGEIRCAATDSRDEWRQALQRPAPPSHAWLLERLRTLPSAPEVPAELGLGRRLLPSSGGRLVGQVLGSNVLLAVAATGGFSTVYAAENVVTGERVAVKVLESAEAKRHLGRFRQEFDKLCRAGEHPNVIRCFEWGNPILDGREYPWYSMEFALGGDLAGRIEERQAECGTEGMPWERPALRSAIVREFRAIASAVAHLHGLGIVHRDIKPGNVLIMGDGELRLTDFGLVKDLQPEEVNPSATLYVPRTSTGAVLGTRHYMAPEQERGEAVEKPADVYALGVLLVELATGQRPMPHSHISQGPTLAASTAVGRLPGALRKFILRLTDVAPDRRPADGHAVLDEFTHLTEGEPT